MTNQKNRPKAAADLRQKAEALARERAVRTSEDSAALSPGEIQRVLHELRVHQIELEMQNEELRAAQAEIEASRTRYFDLFDLAPMGYCTLSEKGLILEANLTAATLLGVTRSVLVKQPISHFILKEDQDIYYLHRKRLFETGEPQECELRLVKPDGARFWVHLTATAAQTEDGAPLCRVVLSDITERKRAEEARRQSDERFRIAQDMSPDGFTILRPVRDTQNRVIDFTWVYENDSIARLNGTDPQKVVGQRLLELFPGHREKQFMKTYQQVAESGKSITFEEKYSGESMQKQTWFRIVVIPMAENIAILAQDITERKLAEEQIRFQAHIIENSPMIAAYHDTDLNLVWVNRAYQKATGLSLEEVRGRKCYQVWNLSTPCRGCPVITAIETGESAAHELTPDNQDYWPKNQGCWLSQAVPDRNEQGTVIGAIEFAIDITERKLTETYREMGQEILQILNEPGDLQESIQRVFSALKIRTGVDAVGLRLQEGDDFPYFVQDGFSKDFLRTENTLLERGKDGGVCRDKDGNVRLECTCGLVISGKTDPSNPLFTQGGSCWTNDSFPLLDLPSDQDPRMHPRNNCIHQGYASMALIPVRIQDQMYSRETCIRHGFSSMAQVPVRTRGRILGLIQLNDKRKGRFTLETIEILEGIAAHIGSALMRKRAEDEREKLQAQFNQAQKLESIGQLTGGIAHDFNNLMTTVIGNSDLILADMAKDDPLREDVEYIKAAGNRAASLTRQLLAFSRKQMLEPVVMNLNDAVRDMDKMLRRMIGEDIEMETILAPDLGEVEVDENQVGQVMMNLSVNARDAMPGGGKLTIETANAELDEEYARAHISTIPGSYVMLAVSDTGLGMTKDVQEKIFEPFFTTKEKGRGTGLGLSTVYGIVKQSRGNIWVYSEPGEGTTFKIYLPRIDKPVSETDSKVKASKAPTGSETVLVVEDDEPLRKLSIKTLEKYGYTVLTAADGRTALSMCEEYKDPIHLMVTDVIMPGMNGKALANRLKVMMPDLKVLYMSGYTDKAIVRHGVLEMGIAFLQKPFTPEGLVRKVREVLETDGRSD